jgi:hypothetical protein
MTAPDRDQQIADLEKELNRVLNALALQLPLEMWLEERYGAVSQWQNEAETNRQAWLKADARLVQLTAAHARLREALEKHGKHSATCAYWASHNPRPKRHWQTYPEDCNCGLIAALREADALRGSEGIIPPEGETQ